MNGSRSFVVESGNDGVELIKGESFVVGSPVVNVGRMDQLQKFVVVDSVVELLGNYLELLEVNCPVLILVEKGEDSSDAVLGLGLSNSGSDDVNELIQSDRFVLILEAEDQVEDEGVSLVQAELFKNFVDLNGINSSTVILVKDLESVD
jgi:hypothetical protein